MERDGDASWVELVRDLSKPITVQVPSIAFSRRWADEGDIEEIAALEGFVKTIERKLLRVIPVPPQEVELDG